MLRQYTAATDDPCGVALGKVAPKRTDQSSADANGQQDARHDGEDRNKLEKAGDAVKDMFDETFGQ